jgi:hypothetical protein
VLPKELEVTESLSSTSKLTLRWQITFLLRQHSLERKPRLLLDGLDHSEVWQLSQWVYSVKQISTKKRHEVHANALRFYHDPSLNVELSVEKQLAFDEARVYKVERIKDVQKRGEKWMLRMKWKNYDEKTWREARQLHQDVPDLINAHME